MSNKWSVIPDGRHQSSPTSITQSEELDSESCLSDSLWTFTSTDFNTPLRSDFGRLPRGEVTTPTIPPCLGNISKSSSGIWPVWLVRSWRENWLLFIALAFMEVALLVKKARPLKKRTRTAGALATRKPAVSSTVLHRRTGEIVPGWTMYMTILMRAATMANSPAAKRPYNASFFLLLILSWRRLQRGINKTRVTLEEFNWRWYSMHLRSCWSPHRRCSPLLDDGSLALNSLAPSAHWLTE